MTNQEYFDKSVNHIRTQGCAAFNGTCRYRHTTTDGKVLSCGIGGLIPDAKYDPDFENCGVGRDDIFAASGGDKAIKHQQDLAKSLQSAHDNAAMVTNDSKAEFLLVYEDRVKVIAKHHHLKYTQG